MSSRYHVRLIREKKKMRIVIFCEKVIVFQERGGEPYIKGCTFYATNNRKLN